MTQSFQISDSPEALNLPWICAHIKGTYWGGWLTDDQIIRSTQNSLCFGVYRSDDVIDGGEIAMCGEQVGFGRAITDGVTFSSLMDIYIERQYRNQGLGTMLINRMLAHPAIKPTICIISTQDGSLFYEKWNFNSCGTVLKRDPVN